VFVPIQPSMASASRYPAITSSALAVAAAAGRTSSAAASPGPF